MAITLTQPAAERVKAFLDNRGKGIGLRLGVKTMGCSGMSYVLEFVDDINPEDEVFEDSGIKVIVDKKSLVYLDGTELDYRSDLGVYVVVGVSGHYFHDGVFYRRNGKGWIAGEHVDGPWASVTESQLPPGLRSMPKGKAKGRG